MYIRSLILVILTLFALSCQPKQYGVGTLNYENRQLEENRNKIASHGDKSRTSTGTENDRIKFYNNPEYRRKKLQKKLQKRQKKKEEVAAE